MQVFHSFEEAQDYTATVVALGTFDGVHLGHQMVMKTAIDTARRLQAKAVVVTFVAHPLSVLCPEKEPVRLATVQQKERYIRELGLDGLVLLPMNRHLIDESPDEFCQQLLDYLHPKSVVVGANFTYGARAAGNTETLRDFMDGHGVPVQVLHLLERPGRATPISSTVIRKLVLLGHMETAANLLGRPFEIEGMVVEGDRRGRLIGFPTANMEIPPRMAMPPDGVYVTDVFVDGAYRPAMTNIGDNPTFTNQYRRIETHIIDWQGDIYGKCLCVRFYKRLRHEIPFQTTEALQRQMEQDQVDALNYLDDNDRTCFK